MSEVKRYSPSIEWDDNTNQKEVVMIKCVGGSWIKYDDYARLKAENERLRKAGDAMVELLCQMDVVMDMDSDHPEVEAWNAAKEGKQP